MKKIDWLFNTPIAHRGLHNEKIAENSLSAFSLAVQKGFSIEIDVHLSADGEVLVFHDYNIIRMCGIDMKITDVKASELDKYKLANTSDTIPTLRKVLELINGKVGLLVEIKYKRNNKNLFIKLYELLKDYKGDVAIQSFSPSAVKWFAQNAPEIPRGLLASSYQDMNFPKIVQKSLRLFNRLIGPRYVKMTNPDFIAYNILSFPSPTMKKYRDNGMPFLTWTVRDTDQLKFSKEWADNIIFENLDISIFN